MSSPVRAVVRQCTLRRSSPCRYSRTLTSSSPWTAIERRLPAPPPPWPPDGPPRPPARPAGAAGGPPRPDGPPPRGDDQGDGVRAGGGAQDQAEGVDQPQPQRAQGVP